MPAAIIFDMDGTLFQTNKILELSLDDTFAYLTSLHEWSGETPIQKYREIMGVPLPVVWEMLLPSHSNEIRESANEFFHEKLIANINNGSGALYPHVYEVLGYLKQAGYSIFIASNGQIEYLNAIVNYYKLNNWVKETFSIQQIQTLNKSDLVCHILKKYDIDNAAVVGDRLSDINAAKNNGLMAIGCRFDFAQEDELIQADAIIDDLIELRTLLNL
ncbi:adenosylhomocysteine nucleosidase [Paenibacillus castaneae]|uniref:HAD hydrolase-like protein n=1 Tax=Paenibacillus castaneae TaxID=474957 RepID=UPI000C9C2AFE|nr:HAD hydrolase-like protein [Paenibacillus castaneae]NIK79978.1 adenosylhomocysteine nucleosidase [Paenibacillus castaneae]